MKNGRFTWLYKLQYCTTKEIKWRNEITRERKSFMKESFSNWRWHKIICSKWVVRFICFSLRMDSHQKRAKNKWFILPKVLNSPKMRRDKACKSNSSFISCRIAEKMFSHLRNVWTFVQTRFSSSRSLSCHVFSTKFIILVFVWARLYITTY